MANVMSVYGISNFGSMRNRHPVATSIGSSSVSLGSMRGCGANVSGWFDRGSFSGNVWLDRSVALKPASVTRGTVVGNTANNIIQVVRGTSADGLRFDSTMVPEALRYTLFHLTKYTPVTPRGRIFDAVTGNWLSGFWAGLSGVAYHGYWLTNQIDRHGIQWVSSTDQLNLYRSNKVDRTVALPPVQSSSTFQISINDGNWTGERTSFECAEVVCFDRLLSNSEIFKMESYIADRYYLDIPTDPLTLLHVKDIALTSGQANVSPWGSSFATVHAPTWSTFVSGPNVPIAYGSGGYNDGPFMQFNRALSHHFDAGLKLFNIATNGGFTALVLMRFVGSGSVAKWERILDFGSGANATNILFGRLDTTNQLNFYMRLDSSNGGAVPISFSSSAVIVQNEWAVFACRYSASPSTKAEIFKNNVEIGNRTGFTAPQDRVIPICYVGRSHFAADAYLGADMKTLLVYDRALSDAEMLEAYTHCTTGQGVPPSAPSVWLDASHKTGMDNAYVSSSALSTNIFKGINFPQASSSGGYSNSAYVRLDRASSHHFNAGTRTLNIQTNGGFTAIAHVKFRGASSFAERIFDFGNGAASNNILLFRVTDGQLGFEIHAPSATRVTVNSNIIIQDEWAVFACRYLASNSSMQIYKNNVLQISSAGPAVANVGNRTLTNTYIGRSNWGDPYSNLDIQSFLVYDRALTDTEMTATYNFCVSDTKVVPPLPLGSLVASHVSGFGTLERSPVTKTVSNWGGFSGMNSPIAYSAGGYNDGAFVRFSRLSMHYLSGGTRILTTGSSGGFNVTLMVRMTGTVQFNERLFEFNNGQNIDSVIVMRYGTEDRLAFWVYNGTVAAGAIASPAGSLVQNEWAVWTARYAPAGNGYRIELWKNNALVATSILGSFSSKTYINSYIGGVYQYSSSDIAFLAVWDRSLTFAEMTQVNTFCRYGTGSLPTTPVDMLIASALTISKSVPLTTWNGIPAFNLPIAYSTNPINYAPFVQFNRTSSQYINKGASTLNAGTGGGFTCLAMMRFTGTPGSNERIFDLGNANGSNTVVLHRSGTTTGLAFVYYINVSPAVTLTATATITQGEWAVFACRMNNSTGLAQVFKNNVVAASASGISAMGNRSFVAMAIGKSWWATDAYLNGDIKTLVMYDRSLTDAEMTQAHSYCFNDVGSLPTVPWLVVEAVQLTTYVAPTFTPVNNPQMYHASGFLDSPYVRTERASIQSVVGGPRNWNVQTGGGFTVLATIKFRGTPGIDERIVDFPSTGSDHFGFHRNYNNAGLAFYSGPTVLYSSTANVIVQDEWAVFACRFTNPSTMAIFKNNVSIASRTDAPACVDRVLLNSYIARSNWTSDHTDADIKNVVVYDRALSTAEMTQAFNYCAFDIGALPSTPWSFHTAHSLIKESNNGTLPFWGLGKLFRAGTVPGPSIVPIGGYGGRPYVQLERSKSHHFVSSTPLTLNMTTNGGFTAIVHMRFTGTVGEWERIFDFGNGPNGFNVFAGRNSTSNQLIFSVRSASSGEAGYSVTAAVIVQGEWAVYTFRYSASTGNMEIYKNNVQVGLRASTPTLADRTLAAATCYIGRSNFAGDSYLNADIRACMVYDRSLTDAELVNVHAFLKKSEFVPSPLIRSFGNLNLWLDAEHSAKFSSSSTTWTDLSGKGNDFSVTTSALTTVGNVSYMRFTDAGTGVATRSTKIILPQKYTIVTFTNVLNSTAYHRTLIRGAFSPTNYEVHPVLTGLGSNVIGEWWNYPAVGGYSGTFSSYNITNLPNVYTKMNMMAFRLSNVASLPWEMLAAPLGNVQVVANITNSTVANINNDTNVGFVSIGGMATGGQYWGNVASFMFFDRLLSNAEIQSIYDDQWARYSLVTPSVRGTSGLILWLDAEYSASIDSTPTKWKDLSDSGYDFTIASNALTTSGGISYMNFSGTAGIAQRLVSGTLTNVPLPVTGSTVIVFTSIKNSTADWRTLIRSTTLSVHPVLINRNTNIIGQWYGSFFSSTYDVTKISNTYTTMNFMAFQFFSDSISTWAMFAAPDGRVQQVASFSAAINTTTNPVGGFATIGGIHDSASFPQYWGNIASFMAYNRRLSVAEMQKICDENKARFAL